MTHLLIMPSFWGLVFFSSSYLVYISGFMNWNKPCLESILISLVFILCLLTSVVINYGNYKKSRPILAIRTLSMISILALHTIGILGSVIFIYQIQKSGLLVQSVVDTLTDSPLDIRSSAKEQGSAIGIYMSYIGWFAICAGVFYNGNKTEKRIIIFVSILQILSNILFMNKMRLVWVVFIFVISIFLKKNNNRENIDIKYILYLFICLTSIFILYTIFTGKIISSRNEGLHGAIDTLMLYITSGHAYFDHQIKMGLEFTKNSYRSFDSLTKILSIIFNEQKWNGNEFLDFFYIPYPTNVGTAFESIYVEFGIFGLILIMILLSFGFDALGLYAIKRSGILHIIFLSNICFVSLMTFFVQKAFDTFVICSLVLCILYDFCIQFFASWKGLHRYKASGTMRLIENQPIL